MCEQLTDEIRFRDTKPRDPLCFNPIEDGSPELFHRESVPNLVPNCLMSGFPGGQTHLFQNNLVVGVSKHKYITDTVENVMLSSRLVNVVSDIPDVSDFRSERWGNVFSNG